MAEQTTNPITDGGADVTPIVEDMLKVRQNAQGGHAYGELLAEETPAVESATLPPPTVAEVSYIVPGYDAMIASRPAELATVTVAMARPGLSERGWSPEVTGRHPALVAETMAELAGDAAGDAAAEIDPLDAGALAAARIELGFAEVRKNNLRVAAANLAGMRLAEGIGAASDASPAAQAALDQAVKEAQDVVGAQTAPTDAPVPTTTAAKAATTTTTKAPTTSGSTSAS